MYALRQRKGIVHPPTKKPPLETVAVFLWAEVGREEADK
jgi:hypothetical protein